ncbi:MAG TPA: VWA domain-containing protein [Gemmataceae bacterium]|nr:VWA domain-containing protein [Gemmataceae bacterium]
MSSRFLFRRAVLAAALAAVSGLSLPAVAADAKPAGKKPKPKIEVVFCLDTTGSMGGLIQGAKDKIWSISNQIAGGKPSPDLKIGLVAYRDRRDAYITKIVDLTDDLDAIHAKLRELQAAGGGDGPESVNQALDDSVNKIKWSSDKKTLRIIFLVGDAPPHMDYPDDAKYPATCKKACEKGIIINTIQCGGDGECQKHWKEICKLAEGSYAQIAQTGGVVAVATPFDGELKKINDELATSTLVYGGVAMRRAGEAKRDEARKLAAPAAADRAAFAAKDGKAAAYDLLDAIKAKKVKLADLKESELPEQMKKMNAKERQEYLDKLEKRRAELSKKALELDKKRAAYIKEELAKRAKKEGKDAKDSFDNQVLETLRKQAKKHNIDY